MITKQTKLLTTRVLCIILGSLMYTSSVQAQTDLPENANPMIIVPHNQSVGYKARTVCYNVTANVDYTVTSSQDWATVRKGKNNSVYVQLAENYFTEERKAEIVFANTDKNISQTLVITQQRNSSEEEIPTDTYIKPSSATDNSHASYGTDGGISNSYDGKTNTLYHSNYAGGVDEDNPVILTYNFTGVERIDYINYIPRSGGGNGAFGKVKVSYKLSGDTDYKDYGSYDWNMGSSARTVKFTEGLINPTSIRFTVYSGYGGFASCAEMQFYASNTNGSKDFSIFADDLYSKLKDGVTEKDLDSIKNSFVKSLAVQMLAGTYRTDYRVASYPCLLSVESLAESWSNPGSYYDQTPGVTGISFNPGKHAVIVSGIPDELTATLKVVTWYCGLVDGSFKSPRPQQISYTLKNGINIIDYDPESTQTFSLPYKSDYYALAYIDYHADANPDSFPDIKVHFANGIINGYLSPDKTNEEMHEMVANAKNYCMDVLSSKTHTVWTCHNLYKHCKSTSGTIGYRQFMNVLDSIVRWEHYVLGFEKYNRVPKNRTLGYVNFRYFLYRDNLGVSFHTDVEYEHLNCDIMINQTDQIWGISHEWGHLHQLQPYFCWKGTTEISNNINSYYNIRRMKYNGNNFVNKFAPARTVFISDNITKVGKTSKIRSSAYQNASKNKWNEDYYNLCLAMADSAFTTHTQDSTLAPGIFDYNSVDLIGSLAPFARVFAYFTQNGFPDFAPDYYEALRQTHQEGGSVIEKTGGYDKYELVAAAQNGNKNDALTKLAEKYPESIWNKYITKAHCGVTENTMPFVLNYIRKLSRISGYNLFPYFERWGFLRQVATYIGDYGNGWQIFPKAAYDEFKADMDALVTDGTLKEMPDGMVEEISDSPDLTFDKPVFPN